MGIFLFISFLFADLITCGACKMAIRQIFIYQNGILMGVHITKEQTEHPRVKALCEKSRRYWNIYQNSNLAAGSLVCLLAFFQHGMDDAGVDCMVSSLSGGYAGADGTSSAQDVSA